MASFTATAGVGAAMAYADRESGVDVDSAAPEIFDVEAAVERTAIAGVPSLQSELETTDVISQPLGPPTPVFDSGYRDGSWLGAAQFTEWGDVQVQVVVEGGEIADIVVVQVPNDRKSASINSAATPILEGQAISIQGADLDIVSGATYTSRTYAASLQSALDQAQSTNDGTGVTAQASMLDTNGSEAQEIALDS